MPSANNHSDDARFWLGLSISVIAVLFLYVHIKYPSLAIDGPTVALIILACVPWLAPIIKAVELPGGFKIEMQELKSQLVETKGMAQAALTQSDVATQTAAALQPNSSAKLDDLLSLGAEYENVRDSMLPSAARTNIMGSIASKMLSTANQLTGVDATSLITSDKRGDRLAAYLCLCAHPDFKYADALINSIVDFEPDNARFGMFWGLKAVQSVLSVKGNEKLSDASERKLYALRRKAPEGTDRGFLLTQALHLL